MCDERPELDTPDDNAPTHENVTYVSRMGGSIEEGTVSSHVHHVVLETTT